MLKRYGFPRRSGWTIILFGLLALVFIHGSEKSLALTLMPVRAEGGVFQYLPIAVHSPFDIVFINSIRHLDDQNKPQLAFPANVSMFHQVGGTILGTEPVTVTMQITESGDCGNGVVFSSTVTLPPGNWGFEAPAHAPGCPGVYTSTVVVEHEGLVDQLAGQFLVNAPVESVYTSNQGFDRCLPPSIDELQTWWNASPYYVYNIYLGGVHYPSFCQDDDVDAFWVRAVAEQGWQFTATWVGPQAPCTSFTHKISQNLATAYSQGQAEADLAAAAARSLGLFGELTLIYDIEGYGGDLACRNAVDSFIQGWTDQVHALGFRAGAYGSPCNSHIADWNNNNPAPDQVWIAHWQLPAQYNPSATVWDVPCGVSNSMWADNQRIKQYAGDHVETWGGVSITIDSNVFDSFVIESSRPAVDPSARITGFAPTGDRSGWLLAGGRLFATPDLGASWTDFGPAQLTVLAADFADAQTGWAAGLASGSAEVRIASTQDGGKSWEISELPAGLDLSDVAGIYLETVDSAHVYLAVRIASGSAFSLGRLFVSADGGSSWEERPHPLGEAVHFRDALNGWTSGGPDGRRAFTTGDGGRTWQAVALERLSDRAAADQLPTGTTASAAAGDAIWALVRIGTCEAEKSACRVSESLQVSYDGGGIWVAIQLPGD